MELGSWFARTHRNVCTECGIYYGACQKTKYLSLFDERKGWLVEARGIQLLGWFSYSSYRGVLICSSQMSVKYKEINERLD